jgi:hypothetical protein
MEHEVSSKHPKPGGTTVACGPDVMPVIVLIDFVRKRVELVEWEFKSLALS